MDGPAAQKWLRRSIFQIVLAVIAAVAFWQMAVTRQIIAPSFATSGAISSLGSDVSLGYFASWIFNLLVVVIPLHAKRRRMKNWLAGRYLAFKDDLVCVYLSAINTSYDSDLIESLRNPKVFSDYFSERYSTDQNRWHAVHNALYEQGLSDIRFHCRVFLSEYDLVVGLVGDLDSALMYRYGHVRSMLLKTELAQPEYDSIKSLLNMLYPIHCPWSFLDGKIHQDFIMDGIKSI